MVKGNTSLWFSLFQLLRETPTHFASEAENPQEAQRKPREVSTHNVLTKPALPNGCASAGEAGGRLGSPASR